jgi:flavorubredoxin
MENEIVEGIYWVGVHFPQPPGASVNAFLIRSDKTALIDAGPVPTAEAVLGNIRKFMDPARIDYIVLTHAEIDHCGGLKRIMEEAKNAKVVVSQIGAMMLPLYGVQTQPQVVKDGDVLDLGKRKLRFVFSPIVDT